MSFVDSVMSLVGLANGTVTVKCPECGAKSDHSIKKVRRNSSLICPKCHKLFIAK